MAKTLLTDRLLDRTNCRSGRKELWDTIVPGFGVRISSQQKSFFFSFWSPTAKTSSGNPVRRRAALGEYPATRLTHARTRAVEIRDQVDQGVDPFHVVEVKPEVVVTFEQLALDYMARYAKKQKRSWENDERIIQYNLLPTLGTKAAGAITARDVRRLIQEISVRAPVHANRVHATLRSIFNWGVNEWDLEVNPGRMVGRLNREMPRDRVLVREELRALWAAWSRSFDPAAAMLKLRLLTAQRGSQLLRLHQSELEQSGEDLWWNVPATSTKSRRPYRIWLGPLARKVLRSVTPDSEGSLFHWEPKRETRQLHDCWKRTNEMSKPTGVTNWQPRDLRRTAATLMAQGGVSRFIIKRVLGHTDREITAVYDLYSYDREVKEAVLTLESAVREIVGEPL